MIRAEILELHQCYMQPLAWIQMFTAEAIFKARRLKSLVTRQRNKVVCVVVSALKGNTKKYRMVVPFVAVSMGRELAERMANRL